jgi:hypothetical protein
MWYFQAREKVDSKSALLATNADGGIDRFFAMGNCTNGKRWHAVVLQGERLSPYSV